VLNAHAFIYGKLTYL